ncbi:unnamed protein product, partial [Diamesa tonsa]
MSTEVINNNCSSIEQKLEKARTNLKDLNENIKRIFGKNDNFSDRKRSSATFDSQRRNDSKNERNFEMPQSKQRRQIVDTKSNSVFSRLSNSRDDADYDDYPNKPKISSRVIKEQPTRDRKDALAAQSSDEKSRARNKRMFGSLMGTLQKFCQEESRLKPAIEKKAKIEKKLEEKDLKEKEKMKQEKDNLMSDRKRKQLEIKALEIKMYKLKDLKAWEDSKKALVNFIGTKNKPQIFYLPKVMNPQMEENLLASQKEVKKMIENRREEVEEEIKAMESRFEGDIKAIDEGKFNHKSTKEEFDDEDMDHGYYNNSDGENDQQIQQSEKNV